MTDVSDFTVPQNSIAVDTFSLLLGFAIKWWF